MRQLFAIFETGFTVHLIRCKVFANACTPEHLFFSISSVRQSVFFSVWGCCSAHKTQTSKNTMYFVLLLGFKLTEVFKKGLNGHDCSLARSQICQRVHAGLWACGFFTITIWKSVVRRRIKYNFTIRAFCNDEWQSWDHLGEFSCSYKCYQNQMV